VNDSHDSSNIIWSIVDDEAVLLDTLSGHYFSLNPMATEIWKRLHQGDAIPHIVSTIADKCRVDEEVVRRDVNDLLGELRAARLLEVMYIIEDT
jgi:PqqD family protein of HPr-rel-A system